MASHLFEDLRLAIEVILANSSFLNIKISICTSQEQSWAGWYRFDNDKIASVLILGYREFLSLSVATIATKYSKVPL